ncbi:MAG: phosphotransferase family protein, partial [Acidimicrobiia bacterium]
RAQWSDMPEHVRGAIDEIAGSPVVDTCTLQGGFSPGPAARCRLADGRVVFVKAAGLSLNPQTPEMHRREARVLAALHQDVPAPSLIGSFDDGDWVALVIEWVEGSMPVAPLATDAVDRILDLVRRLAGIDGAETLLSVEDAHPGLFGHWRQLADAPPDGLDAWSRRHLEELVELEADAAVAVRGDRLVHVDLRSDNVILAHTGGSEDVIVDWPGAAVGAPWVDLVGLLPALELDGGPTPEQVFEQHPVGRAADPDAVTSFVVAVAGYFTRMSLMDPPPGLPTVRQFQAAQGRVARRWVASRRRWPPS